MEQLKANARVHHCSYLTKVFETSGNTLQDYSENDLQSILLFKMAFNLTYSSIKLQHLSHPQWVMSTSKTKAFSLSQNPMASVASKMKMQTKTFAACQVHRYLTG